MAGERAEKPADFFLEKQAYQTQPVVETGPRHAYPPSAEMVIETNIQIAGLWDSGLLLFVGECTH